VLGSLRRATAAGDARLTAAPAAGFQHGKHLRARGAVEARRAARRHLHGQADPETGAQAAELAAACVADRVFLLRRVALEKLAIAFDQAGASSDALLRTGIALDGTVLTRGKAELLHRFAR